MIFFLREREIVIILEMKHLLPQKRSGVWCFSTFNKGFQGWQDIISVGGHAYLIDCQRTSELTSLIFSSLPDAQLSFKGFKKIKFIFLGTESIVEAFAFFPLLSSLFLKF